MEPFVIGPCLKRIASGRGTGLAQCEEAYHLKLKLRRGAEARCALFVKGIRYWEDQPTVFDLDLEEDYTPWPFGSAAFQWGRNIVLAHE